MPAYKATRLQRAKDLHGSETYIERSWSCKKKRDHLEMLFGPI